MVEEDEDSNVAESFDSVESAPPFGTRASGGSCKAEAAKEEKDWTAVTTESEKVRNCLFAIKSVLSGRFHFSDTARGAKRRSIDGSSCPRSQLPICSKMHLRETACTNKK